MTGLDWIVLAVYLAGMLAMSVWVGRSQSTNDDYYLAGRRMGAWPIALSILATQVSAISLVGAPAFVALKPGGGLHWLQYEFAVPLAMIAVLAILVPAYHAAGATSIYELLERRFGPAARRTVSAVFLVSRGAATGTALYAASLVVSVLLGVELLPAMLSIAAVAVLYTTIGGIRADIITDIVQLFILWIGTAVCVGVAAAALGDAPLWSAVAPERLTTVDPAGTGTFGLAPMLLGGFFLYVSYYGCDQSQAQRLLTSASPRTAQRALLLNGLLRFPLAATYCGLGVVLAALLAARPDFAARIPADDVNRLVPLFLLEFVGPGLRGLIVAGVFAAAMSSFDSAFNSLSAATVRDFVEPWTGRSATLRESRAWTAAWGAACTVAGVAFTRSASTVIELVNQIGSLFYGPVLAVFILAVLSRRATGRSSIAGLLTGLAANVAVWRACPQVSWLWWNVIGFGAAAAIGLAGRGSATVERISWPRGATISLVGATIVIVALCVAFQVGVT